MKKRKSPRGEQNPEDRKRKINFKKKKQKFEDDYYDLKNIKYIEDLEDYD